MKRASGERFERRRSRRVSASRVSVVGARLVNVSPTGMMIESPVPMERTAVHRFRLVINGHKVDVEARVVACAAGAAGRRPSYGVGLEFTRIPTDARERLACALAEPAERAHPR